MRAVKGLGFGAAAVLSVAVVLGVPSAADAALAWRRSITIPAASVQGGTDLANFPLLVSLADASLRSTANGGRVYRVDGGDIQFRAADGTTVLDHEIEDYDPTTGTLVAWVRLPLLSASAPTTVYLYYGDVGAPCRLQSPAGVWSAASYTAVYHQRSAVDSGPLAQDAVDYATTSTAGQVGRARALAAAGRAYEETASSELRTATSFTLSAWFRTNDVAARHHILWQGDGEGTGWGDSGGGPANHEMHLSIGDAAGAANRLSFFLGSGTTAAAGVLSVDVPFADTTAWHHVAAVVQGLDTVPTVQLYLDGAAAGGDAGTLVDTSRAGWDTPLRIGRPGLAQRTFDGAIDEVRVATVARSAGWIATERANQAAPAAFYTVGAEDGSAPAAANGCVAAGTPGLDGALTVAGTQVLNRYAALAANAPRGATSLTLVDATPLAPLAAGDLLLVVQMQGATIDEDPASPRYGTVQSLGNAGRYELATVASVAGNVVSLRCARGLAQAYTAGGHAQVVRVPQYTNLTVNGRVTATPWNGATGGVVALRADTIAIGAGASIDATAAGFRGGAYEFGDGTGATDYGLLSPLDGAQKGEGLAGPAAALAYTYGRGASANGGGGGDAHNAAGGGGANAAAGSGWCIGAAPTAAEIARCGQGVPDPAFAAEWALDPTLLGTPAAAGGGRGGYSWAANAADPTVDPPGDVVWGGDDRREVGGLGGHPAPGDTSSRIFLGGGGGAGHANTNPVGDGGRGGGIVLLIVRSLGGGGTIAADGAKGGSTTGESRDGPSGGGAGGTVVIQASGRVDATLSIHANGGDGGDQPASSTLPAYSYGPGGGGGGGLVTIASPDLLATASVAGGANGQTGSTSVAPFTANGATRGGGGRVATGTIPLAIPGDCLPTAVVGGSCPVGTVPSGVNLVTNGSFAAGATGFTSGIPNAGPLKPFDTSFSIRTGHECFSGAGVAACPNLIDQQPFPGDAAVYAPAAANWMYVNGNNTGGPYMPWQQTVATLTPGTTYLFSFHASNAFAPGGTAASLPVLRAMVDGVTVGPDFEAPYETVAQGDTWSRFAATFTTGAAQTAATLSIWDTANGTNGDDWALSGIGLQACTIPTAVTLASFEARPGDGTVALEWSTASELDNAGFHLYRGLSAAGPWQRLDAVMIEGLGSSPIGRAYAFTDRGLVNGVPYYYRLEDVDTSGRATPHGPVSATPRAGAALPGDSGSDAAGTGDGGLTGGGTATTVDARRAYGRPEDHGVTVVERGPSHVVVELRTGGFWATPLSDGSVRLEAPGLVLDAAPGAPGVPVRTVWLDAVPGRGARLGVVHTRGEVAFDLRPEAAGRPEMGSGPDGLPRARMRRRAEGPAFRGLFPAEAARLVETGFLGGAKKVRLEIAPLRWDAARRGVVLARRVRVRIDFAGREAAERAGRPGHWLRRPRCAPPSDRSVLARLEVSAPGLYAVRFEDLPPGTRPAASGDLRLLRRGEPVAFHVEPAGGAFGPGRTLYFLSAGASLNPEGAAVYELARGGGGREMAIEDASPVGAPAVPAAWTTATFEKNVFYQPGLLDAPDPWLWDAIAQGAAKSYPFAVAPPAIGGGSARIVVDLQGATDDAAVDFDHHLLFRLSGTVIGEALWEGKAPYHASFDVPSGLLAGGSGLLEIEGRADTGASVGLVFLDKFSVTFPRALVAENGRFEAAIDEDGTASLAGLAGALVLETSAPSWIAGAVADAGALAFSARAGGRYLAVAPSAVQRPLVRSAAAAGLRRPTSGADWLLVAPRALLAAARPLVVRRAAQGLRARAVAVEDVYDEFGCGEHSAAAVRAFLVHAYQEWPQPGPRYVVLLGDATVDPKGYTAGGRPDLVPTPIVRTPYLWTASDPSYAAVNGDDALPDLAIGRLPADTAEEAAALVAKVLAYEEAGLGVDGRQVLVADNPDVGGDFEAHAEEIAASLPAGRTVDRVYLSKLGAGTKAAVLGAFDAGASVVSYVGHGAAATWASEAIFTSFDVALLQPQAEQPVVLTLNCLNGYFVAPSFDALAEALAKAPGRGAIAAVSPSGLSLDAPAHELHLALERALASTANRTLGDAFLAAQADYAQSGGPADVLAVYHLFGDPGLRLR